MSSFKSVSKIWLWSWKSLNQSFQPHHLVYLWVIMTPKNILIFQVFFRCYYQSIHWMCEGHFEDFQRTDDLFCFNSFLLYSLKQFREIWFSERVWNPSISSILIPALLSCWDLWWAQHFKKALKEFLMLPIGSGNIGIHLFWGVFLFWIKIFCLEFQIISPTEDNFLSQKMPLGLQFQIRNLYRG